MGELEESEVALSKGKANKNPNGAGSIRKRSDGRWEARYSNGWTKTGRQRQISIYGKTQQEVRQKLAKVIAEIDEGTHIEPSKIKVGEWMEIWLDEYCGDKKYSTVKGYRANVRTHIKPEIGNIPLGKLTTTDIQKFYNRLLKPPDGSPGICPKTIKNTHGVLSKAMSVAVVNGYIRSNPCVGTILPRVEKHEVQPLTDDQVALLLQQAEKDEEYGLLLKVILLTGVRKAEAMGITWDCVDFRRGVIHINKQLQKRPKVDGGVMFTSSKNGKGRVLKPAPYVMELMKKRYEQQIRQKENASVAWRGWQTEAEHRTALAFTTLFGTPLQPQTVYNHFKKIAVEIGAPNAKVHDLRHTYAVLSLQNGDDVKTVQGNLGHATAAFTLDVYGHVSEAMKTASANRMEEYVRQIPDI
ncbi:MAG: site-specific integrase [Oscillospiraceae bacterium]|nr:site-specific integrase [Oscillospiraceae bacterium]